MNNDDNVEVDEIEFTKRVRAGDQDALAILFEIYKPRLQNAIGLRLDHRLRGRIDEQDVLQEVYLDLASRLEHFAGQMELSVLVWMRLAVKDRLISLHRMHIQAIKRDARREVSIHQQATDSSSADIAATLAESMTSVGGKVAKTEVVELILKTLESLDDSDRECIIMRNIEGLTNQEVSEELGLSVNGASSRYTRALAKLKNKFTE